MAQGALDFGARYDWVKDLGSGAFGTAQLMRDRITGEQVAVKYIPLRDVDRNVERELLNHRKLSGHPNIVRFKEAFVTSTHLGIAMEYASGGDLFDYVVARGRLTEDVARFYFQQLVQGVAWCHSMVVSHRDIKLENTLLEGWGEPPRAKICDFGYSKDSILNSRPDTICGTPAYMAPEVLAGGEYDGGPVDVWSCGVALYVMLVGSLPFQDPKHPNSYPRMVERISQVRYHIPPQLQLSPGCEDMIRRIFVLDPKQRISLQEVQQHAWFRENLPLEGQNGGQHLQLPLPTQTEPELVAVVQLARQGHVAQTQQQPLGGEYLEDEHLMDDGADLEFIE